MKKTLKITSVALGALVALCLLGFAAATVKANARLQRKFETHRIELSLPAATDLAAIERGKHLVEARYACTNCHGGDFAGGVMFDDPAIGKVLGPNITSGRGGRTARYTMADWDRIVRHGVKPDGSPAVMPSEDFFEMSDEELSDIVAYVRSRPAVAAEVPAPSFGPVGKVMLAVGKLPISAERQPAGPHRSRAPAADDPQYGEHLAAVCVGCHRANFAGGPLSFGPPDWPAAANLTQHASGLQQWSSDDFERALTQGLAKDGHALREPMSSVVAGTKAMTPAERAALWTYLRSRPAVATNP